MNKKVFYASQGYAINNFEGEKMMPKKSYVELITHLKKIEESMVAACAALEERVHTAAAKLLMAELRLDSTKHASICDEILKAIEKAKPIERLWDARIESYVDMLAVKKELERHIKLETEMLQHVEKMIRETDDEALKVLLAHIAEDEKKHHKNIKLILDKSYALAP